MLSFSRNQNFWKSIRQNFFRLDLRWIKIIFLGQKKFQNFAKKSIGILRFSIFSIFRKFSGFSKFRKFSMKILIFRKFQNFCFFDPKNILIHLWSSLKKVLSNRFSKILVPGKTEHQLFNKLPEPLSENLFQMVLFFDLGLSDT